VPARPTRIVVALVVVLATVVIVVLAAGWLDDKAPPGSRGRVPVSAPATTESR
jgi:hypothetical protein